MAVSQFLISFRAADAASMRCRKPSYVPRSRCMSSSPAASSRLGASSARHGSRKSRTWRPASAMSRSSSARRADCLPYSVRAVSHSAHRWTKRWNSTTGRRGSKPILRASVVLSCLQLLDVHLGFPNLQLQLLRTRRPVSLQGQLVKLGFHLSQMQANGLFGPVRRRREIRFVEAASGVIRRRWHRRPPSML